MAKQDGATEKATPRKRQKAREEGNIAQSKDLTLFFSLFVFLLLVFFGKWFVVQLMEIYTYSLNLIQQGGDPYTFLVQMGKKIMALMVPIMLIVLTSMGINYYIQVKFNFSIKAVQPKLERLNPKNYVKRVFSKKTAVDLILSMLKIFILGYVVYYVLRGDVATITGAMLLPWNQSLLLFWSMFKNIIVKVIVAFFVISVVDFIFQKRDYENNLKMKKEDVKREYKEQNGSPEVKGKQREMMIEVLKKEILQKMPEATFTVTNPTHYAVAVRYKKGEGKNPQVIVKGIDHVALFMKELSKQNEVPIVENPKLARELYQRCVEKEDIPEDLWAVIAEILHELLLTKQIKLD